MTHKIPLFCQYVYMYYVQLKYLRSFEHAGCDHICTDRPNPHWLDIRLFFSHDQMLHQAKKKKGALRHCFSPLQPDMIDFSGTVGLGTMHRGGVALSLCILWYHFPIWNQDRIHSFSKPSCVSFIEKATYIRSQSKLSE